ncbi:MAG: SpoIIE family protein phosphatase, partial [Krumholzibacteria bacterium]|nr:SpoIIE family protein phosphatase [Candidatus Krumholzibacteria bacterium]
PRDTTAWFAAGGDLWLMRWRDLGTPEASAQAWLLGQRPLTELSRLLRCGVLLTAVGTASDGANVAIGVRDPVVSPVFTGRRAMYRDVTGDATFWSDWRYFGGTLLEVMRHREGRLDGTSLFLTLRTGWSDLRGEFLEGENNLNVAVVIALAVVAFLFLVIEIFALFFGVRISEGIIAAVRVLGRGTRAVAAGDLLTRIDLPNEDEFGDLGASFNEMTRAVRQGRDDALARERLTRELQTAREIQERLLPHAEPRLPGFEITGASIPSREIGGDYFDFIVQADDRMGIAIGDVSGKGMPAALLMANLQASLHGQVIHPSSVAEVVARVNDLLVASTDPHMFATFFYGVLDTGAGVFTTANAGHNPPLVLRTDGSTATLGEGGLLLGMLARQAYVQQETRLEPGDVVVLYTDGITEAAGPSAVPDDPDNPDAMFGEAALLEVVRRHAHLPAVGIKEAILAAVAEHTAGAEQSDDITLVVIRRQD